MMKKQISKAALAAFIIFFGYSCTELDLVQQDAAVSSTWYSNPDEFRQSINELYRGDFWLTDHEGYGWTDDFQHRDVLEPIKSGTVSSEYGSSANRWNVLYKAITRANLIAERIANQDGVLSEETANNFLAEVNFSRASSWSYLITHFGDVPFYEGEIGVEESFELPRKNKEEILQKIYEYYDHAAQNLPESYSGTQYATKGAAYALKTRVALYMGDFSTAAEAAKSVIDLNVYELHPDYGDLFLSSTRNSPEIIFQIPRSDAFNVLRGDLQNHLPRNVGGWAARNPTWELLASFEAIDGLPIDESPLFDPRNPFKNRDPRLAETIVPFGSQVEGDGLEPDSGSRYLGFEYNPHPEHKMIMNYATGELTRNNDTRSVAQYASFNGLVWKKGIDEDWIDLRSDPLQIVIRYADVLLMFAEAKIELNEIDDSVLAAINEVRERAYANSPYVTPLVTTTDQDELRLEIRQERRSEFALEGLRYMDLIRWRLAEEALTGYTYGLLPVAVNSDVTVPPTGPLMDNVVDPGLWFWGMVPEINENGLPQFEHLVNAGLATHLVEINFPERQYLWPIPADEILLNPNLTQNPGY